MNGRNDNDTVLQSDTFDCQNDLRSRLNMDVVSLTHLLV